MDDLPCCLSQQQMCLYDRPTSRPHPFDFRVEQLPAPLFGAPFELLLEDRIRHLYPLRVGGFRVERGKRGAVQDVDHVQFRVGFLAQVHRSSSGQLGLAGTACSQQDRGRKDAHLALLARRHFTKRMMTSCRSSRVIDEGVSGPTGVLIATATDLLPRGTDTRPARDAYAGSPRCAPKRGSWLMAP